jgi:hypothetical protein
MAQGPAVLSSSVQSVQVYRAGAVVTRVAELAFDEPGWPKDLLIEGLPLSLEDDSVRASLVAPPGKGGAALPLPCDLRVELAMPPLGSRLEPPSEAQLRGARQEVARLEVALARVEKEMSRLDRLSLELPEVSENRPPRPAPVAAWMGALEWQGRVRRARLEEKSGQQAALRKAREELARIERRDEEARAQKDAQADVVSKRVRLSLRGGGPAVPCQLRLEYRVPGARWFPSYQVRVARDGRSAELSMRALVAQATGESWSGVMLSVSTADLDGDAELPELPSLRIGRRQRASPPRAWRDPPAGADELFEGLDRALAAAPRGEKPPADLGVEQDEVLCGAPAGAPAAPLAEMEEPPAPASAPELSALHEEALPPSAGELLSAPAPKIQMKKMAASAPRLSRSRKAGGEAGEPAPVAGAAPAPQALRAEAPVQKARGAGEREQLAGAAPAAEASSAVAASADQLRFAGHVMAGWQEAARRGRLRPLQAWESLGAEVETRPDRLVEKIAAAALKARGVLAIAAPAGMSEVRASSGGYDHRYVAEVPVDVPGDGAFHIVPLLSRAAPSQSSLVVVPRESDQAVRVAAMENPLGAPLLAGPADVYLEDEFLVTSPMRTAPSGGRIDLGLGVEEAVKVARNVSFEELSHGLMGGGATLKHRVEIEIASRLAAACDVEVRERVPIAREGDKDLDIAIPPAAPPWEEFDQAQTWVIKGGRRWRFSLGPGETQKLAFSYTVKIDSKNELVGGNRRE